MKILTAAQMREADRQTVAQYGIPNLQLMENAGAAVVAFLCEKFPTLTDRNILVLCGKGNNGGDGLVVARRLKEAGCTPLVFLLASPNDVQGDAAVNLASWLDLPGLLETVTTEEEWQAERGALDTAEVIVDALLGTGLRSPVEGLLAKVIADVNASRKSRGRHAAACVVAVDIPSGLSSEAQDFGGAAIEADFTVTFTAPKVGQLLGPRAANCGELILRNIGTPRAMLESDASLSLAWLEPGEFRNLPLVRNPESNKGTYGHALLVAGSRGKTGAAILGARSVLRAGAGLVTVATPADVLPIVAAGMPEMMTALLLATEDGTVSSRTLEAGRFAEIARGKSVLALGPGLSTHPETQQFVRSVIAETELPLIVDADGLNAFAGAADLLKRRHAPAIAITPHPGEMARLLGCTVKEVQSRRLETALETAERCQIFVVLKGFHTVIATPSGDAYVNSTGNAGMATGGTGDVLTGILAGLTAQFGIGDWARILGLGVYLHGLAGDLAASRVGQAPLIASDLIESFPEAYARMMKESQDAC